MGIREIGNFGVGQIVSGSCHFKGTHGSVCGMRSSSSSSSS